MFKRKMNLDSLNLGELKMFNARIEAMIYSDKKEIRKHDEAINSLLQQSKQMLNDFEQRSIARKIVDHSEQKYKTIQSIETLETKHSVLLRLIHMKETELCLHSNKPDILDILDLDDISEYLRDNDVNTKLKASHANNLFRAISNIDDEEFDKILTVVKSTGLDDESITCAKADIEDIIQKNRCISSKITYYPVV